MWTKSLFKPDTVNCQVTETSFEICSFYKTPQLSQCTQISPLLLIKCSNFHLLRFLQSPQQEIFKLLLYFWLCSVFAAAHGFSSSGEQGCHQSQARVPLGSGCSCCGAQALGARALGVEASASLVCPMAGGSFRNQGLNTRPLHWQVDS